MRTLAIRGVLIAGVVCGAVCAQAVEVSLVVAGGSTSIPPGGGTYGEITIDVFVDDVVSPDALRSYQVTLEVVPQPGATGSVTSSTRLRCGPTMRVSSLIRVGPTGCFTGSLGSLRAPTL